MNTASKGLLLLALFAAGCTTAASFGDGAKAKNDGETEEDVSATEAKTEKNESGLPCDVKKVLTEKCQLCHGAEPNYGASTSFVTLDDMKKDFNGKKVGDMVKARIADANRPMPPITAPALADADKKVLTDWLEGGLAAGKDATCAAAQTSEVPKLSCKSDMQLVAKKPFKMAQGGPADTYMCFGVDITTDKKKHLIGFGPKVDNKKILHHILVFEAKETVSPDPIPCNAFQGSWKLITGWAPGGTAFELPDVAGIPLNPGTTHYAVQLHYNNAANLADQEDNSGFDICTTDQLRPNDAGILAFGTTNIKVPPRATETVSCDYELDERFEGATFISVAPHMHKKGMSIGTRRLKGGTGAEEDVFVQDKFDFENQSNNRIDVKVKGGDVFRSFCTFKNPGDQTLKFGENTEDEMCFNFMTYYPLVPDKRGLINQPVGKRLPGGGFNWITPSIEGCGLSLTELQALSTL